MDGKTMAELRTLTNEERKRILKRINDLAEEFGL
jgi:hypothetical protein